jgi:hypothetical protein
MNSLSNLSKITLLSLAITSTFLTGCDSDNNSAELARAVELEALRANGTIIEEFEITNDQLRLKAGETHQLIAIGLDSKGDTRDVTAELTAWTSSDTTIATVSSAGLVTGVKSSDVDQGKVIITGTTINDILGEGEMSVSDVAVSTITLKQTSPETGNIHTCIDASISGDVRYEDDYLSLNTIKNMTFTVDDQTSAIIDEDGMLYTSAEGIENTTVTSKIGTVTGQLTVTADPKDLETIDILLDDKITTVITLNMGDRIQVNAQANLLDTVSTEIFDIDPSVAWQQRDTGLTGITETGTEKGTILALKAGVTELSGVCGGISSKAILEIKGDAELESTQINDGEDTLVIAPLKSVELTLTANYDSAPTSLNVSEFASWEVIGNDIVDIELMSSGLDTAHYKLTSTSASEGSIVLLVTYDGVVSSVRIEIAE